MMDKSRGDQLTMHKVLPKTYCNFSKLAHQKTWYTRMVHTELGIRCTFSV